MYKVDSKNINFTKKIVAADDVIVVIYLKRTSLLL